MPKAVQPTILHNRSNGQSFTFIKDEIGTFLVDCIKFTKKGAIFINTATGLGYWVAISAGNEAILSPSNWAYNMVILSTSTDTILALDPQIKEPETPMSITFDCEANAFMLNNS